MTFLQALRTGKKYKRPADSTWFKRAEIKLFAADGGQVRMLGDADIDANDWDVEAKTYVITKAELNQAIANAPVAASMTTAQVAALKVQLQTAFSLVDG